MIYSNPSEDYRPLTWVGGYPVGLSILLVAIHTAAMIFFALARASGHGEIMDYFIFSSHDLWQRGYFWQLLTYALVAVPSVNFAIQMLMFYWFGPEVERFVGRTAFFALYLALLLIPSLFLAALGFHQQVEFAGPDNLLFGIFIAFVTIYPNVEIFFLRLTVKWLAWILLGIYSLINLSEHQTLSLIMLWLCSAIGYAGMRIAGVGGGFRWFEKLRQSGRSRRQTQRARTKAKQEKQNRISIDSILDKISKQGINSLTAAEKTALENARSALLKRDKNK